MPTFPACSVARVAHLCIRKSPSRKFEYGHGLFPDCTALPFVATSCGVMIASDATGVIRGSISGGMYYGWAALIDDHRHHRLRYELFQQRTK